MTVEIVNCRWCGATHGAKCPIVRAIEYFPDGTVKRVEFLTPADYTSYTPYVPPSLPFQPTYPLQPTVIW